MKFAITGLIVLVAVVQLSEGFFFAKATTPRHPTVRPTTPRHTTRRHFAYAADQATPDISQIFELIVEQLAKYVPPATFQSLSGFWDFYYKNVLKVVYDNIFKKVVAPVFAQQLKAAGITKSEDIDTYFRLNIEAPWKQGLVSMNEALGSLIDSFDVTYAKQRVNDVIDNTLKPFFTDAIAYLIQNKAVIKPHIMSFVKNEYTKDAIDLMEYLKETVKKDIAA